MQKYVKKDSSEIRYFEDDIKVEDWIDLSEYRLMTDEEILKHETPKPTKFHTEWNGTEWIDLRTPEEIAEYERSIMPQLKPMDFELKLVDFGLYDAVQELINSDIKLKIAYNRALYFSRTDPFVEQARQALGLTHKQIDEMWTAS